MSNRTIVGALFGLGINVLTITPTLALGVSINLHPGPYGAPYYNHYAYRRYAPYYAYGWRRPYYRPVGPGIGVGIYAPWRRHVWVY
jgi:hypothetical protein